MRIIPGCARFLRCPCAQQMNPGFAGRRSGKIDSEAPSAASAADDAPILAPDDQRRRSRSATGRPGQRRDAEERKGRQGGAADAQLQQPPARAERCRKGSEQLREVRVFAVVAGRLTVHGWRRFEMAGKDDHQLVQAVNLLKGLQIIQNSHL